MIHTRMFKPISLSFSLSPSKDAVLYVTAPTFNYGATGYLNCQGEGGYTYRPIIAFDITSYKFNVSSAILNLYHTAITIAQNLTVSRVLRSGWVEGTYDGAVGDCCWNNWGGGNAWTTAGCKSAGNDYTTTHASVAALGNTVPSWQQWNITNIYNDCVNASLNSVDLLITTAGSGTANIVQFNSKEAASNKPFLSIISM